MRSIRGVVFWDRNGNGVQDADEPGLSNVSVEIKVSVVGATITTYTDASGVYQAIFPDGPSYVVKPYLWLGWFTAFPEQVFANGGGDLIVNFPVMRPSAWLVVLLVMSLIILGAMVVAVFDRRPLAYMALAKEFEIIARRRLIENGDKVVDG